MQLLPKILYPYSDSRKILNSPERDYIQGFPQLRHGAN